MTSHFLFLTGIDSESIVQRLDKLGNDASLTELYISLVHIDQQVCDAIVKVLQNSQNSQGRTWDGIHLAHCTGKVDVVITTALEHVRKVTLLPDGHTINDSCLYALANGLKQSAVQSLILRVNLCTDLAVALADGLANNAALEDLSLMLSASDRRAIAVLARGIQQNTTLKRLRLNRCSLEDGHVSDLVRALDNHPSLVELSVQGSCCRSKGMIAISTLLKSDSRKLVKLDLSNQQELPTGTCAVSFLASALPQNTTLSFLDLSNNRLSDGDVTSLAAALSENRALQELRLVNCQVSDRSVATLAEHLPRMKGLRKLWLHGNHFDKAVATKRFLEAVKRSVYLHQLLLVLPNKEMTKLQKEMEYYLLLNRGGRQLLTCPNVSASVWPRVFSKAKRHESKKKSAESDILFYLLQQVPALLEQRLHSSRV